MSGVGPSADSYKAPIVLLSFHSVTDVENYQSASDLFTNSTDLPLPLTLPSYNFIQEFEFEFGEGSSWKATFTIFDPYYQILDYIIQARANPSSVHVYFRFGWVADGEFDNLSTAREGVVFDFEPDFQEGGVIIRMHVYQVQTRIRDTRKLDTPITFAESVPAHVIVRDVLTAATIDGATSDISVETPVETKPVKNNGNPIIVKDTFPTGWIRDWLIPRTEPLSADVRGPFRLFENEQSVNRFVFAPEGFRNAGEGLLRAKRTYHVARGRLGQVLSFKPSDVSQFANLIAGEGYTRGVSSSGRALSQADRSGIGADVSDSGTAEARSGNIAYSRFSFDRDPETQLQRRSVMWNMAQAVGLRTEAEIIGDPHILANDYLRFFVYHGASLALMGSGFDSGDERSLSNPQVLLPLSGLYVVLGYRHAISAGRFTTTLTLTKARNPNATSESSYDTFTPAQVLSGVALANDVTVEEDHSDDVTIEPPHSNTDDVVKKRTLKKVVNDSYTGLL